MRKAAKIAEGGGGGGGGRGRGGGPLEVDKSSLLEMAKSFAFLRRWKDCKMMMSNIQDNPTPLAPPPAPPAPPASPPAPAPPPAPSHQLSSRRKFLSYVESEANLTRHVLSRLLLRRPALGSWSPKEIVSCYRRFLFLPQHSSRSIADESIDMLLGPCGLQELLRSSRAGRVRGMRVVAG
eukprot:749047-Hanusia_phi.AAC.4